MDNQDNPRFILRKLTSVMTTFRMTKRQDLRSARRKRVVQLTQIRDSSRFRNSSSEMTCICRGKIDREENETEPAFLL